MAYIWKMQYTYPSFLPSFLGVYYVPFTGNGGRKERRRRGGTDQDAPETVFLLIFFLPCLVFDLGGIKNVQYRILFLYKDVFINRIQYL